MFDSKPKICNNKIITGKIKQDAVLVSWGARYLSRTACNLGVLSPSINHSRIYKLSPSFWTVVGVHTFFKRQWRATPTVSQFHTLLYTLTNKLSYLNNNIKLSELFFLTVRYFGLIFIHPRYKLLLIQILGIVTKNFFMRFWVYQVNFNNFLNKTILFLIKIK